MNELIPRNDDRHLLSQVRTATTTALARFEDVRLIRWVSDLLETAWQFAATMTDSWRYARRDRRQFHSIVRALNSGDGDSRLCAKACEFIHGKALTTRENKQQFITWVCFAYQDNSPEFVRQMAAKTRASISKDFDSFTQLL